MKKTKSSKVRSNKTHKKYLGGSPETPPRESRPSTISSKQHHRITSSNPATKNKPSLLEELNQIVVNGKNSSEIFKPPQRTDPVLDEEYAKWTEDIKKWKEEFTKKDEEHAKWKEELAKKAEERAKSMKIFDQWRKERIAAKNILTLRKKHGAKPFGKRSQRGILARLFKFNR